jgi:hypothetical protein
MNAWRVFTARRLAPYQGGGIGPVAQRAPPWCWNCSRGPILDVARREYVGRTPRREKVTVTTEAASDWTVQRDGVPLLREEERNLEDQLPGRRLVWPDDVVVGQKLSGHRQLAELAELVAAG